MLYLTPALTCLKDLLHPAVKLETLGDLPDLLANGAQHVNIHVLRSNMLCVPAEAARDCRAIYRTTVWLR